MAFAAPKAKPHGPVAPKDKQLPFKKATPGNPKAVAGFTKYDPTVASKLPGAGTAVVDLSAAGGSGAVTARLAGAETGVVRAGNLPILVKKAAAKGSSLAAADAAGGLSRVRVTTADQSVAEKAGVHGVLFSVGTEDAAAGSGDAVVSVDSSSFRAAFGGDYAARLRLVQLPACALTTPDKPECQVQKPVQLTPGDPLSAKVALAPSATPAGAVAPSGTTTGRTAPRPFAAPNAATTSTTSASTATVLAATSTPDGSSGSYSATSLSPAGTWSAGGNTGSFTYSYPVKAPAAIAGATPDVSFSYDSSSQDGRTSGTNNQSSWLGDGWSSTESYVERSYKNCADDTTSGAPQGSGDKCWAGQVLTLSLNGKSTQIVYDGTTFRPADDSATEKVEQLFGASNGANNGEYFRVTENGVQFYFGLNQLPGYSAGKQTTQSVYTMPVYGAHAGDPCNGSSFANSSCTQGWRWNLDYVVDLHGNATAYYYAPETNYYGANAQNTGVVYTRGGTLSRIDYGMTSSTVYSGTAPEQIVFNVDERCITGTPTGAVCDDAHFTTANASWWPDVPIDQNCASGASCTNHEPTFWSRKRLTSVTMQVQVNGATQPVDQYTMVQSFPDGGDHAPTLWLDSVQHTGQDTTGGGTAAVPTPPISFDPPLQKPNRVGTITNQPAMYHDRISTITTESGAKITVTYNPTECTPANVPSDPSTNTMACFPVLWIPPGYSTQQKDWFHKYTVASVRTDDPNTTNQDGTYPTLLTSYKYVGGAAWHYDTNELVKSDNRTYAQFRGYGTVETRTGDTNVSHKTNGTQLNDQLTLSKTYYFRGMSHNTADGTGGTTVNLTSQDGAYSSEDRNEYAGRAFETDTYTGDGGTINESTVTMPTIIGPTATRTRTGLPPLTAQMIRDTAVYKSTAVSYGRRKTETDTFYNTTLGQPTTGMPIQADDRGEPTAAGNVAKCTWTRYVENTSLTLALPAETMINAQDCNTAGASQTGALISDTRTSFDGNAFTWDGASGGTAPTKGDVTLSEVASASNGTTATAYLAKASTSYDSLGRPTSVTRTPNSTAPDGTSLAKTTTTTYTPASGGLVTSVVTKEQVTAGATPTYQSNTTTMDPARALPVEKIDANNNKTDITYDALGRQTAVWLPTQSKATNSPASLTWSYSLVNNGPIIVTAGKLQENDSYTVSETLYDAMLRERQTQAATENNSMTVSDTQYDSHGWKVLTNNAYNLAGSPINGVANVAQATVPDTTVTDHDAMGRATATNEEAASTTPAGMSTATVYTGDTTTVFPRQGGVVSRNVTNARGQAVELDQYTTAPALGGSATSGWTATGGTPQATTYGYTPAGQQATVTGADGSTWSTTYDLQGRKIQATDPDQGTSKTGYDDAGNLVSATDARGIELDYTYDLLGRKLTAVDKSNNNFKFGVWKWDSLQIGKLTYSARYVPGVTGAYAVQYTGYTSMGKPTGTKITLPASEAPLPTTYQTSMSYSPNTQLLIDQRDPGVGNLLGEDVIYGYDALGNTTSMQSGNAYVGPVEYTNYGEVSKITYGPSNNPAWSVFNYDAQLRRISEVQTSRYQAPGPMVDDVSYAYDPSGNRTSTKDVQSESGAPVTDTQCYQFDALDRLSQAWTASGTCSTNPSTGTVAAGSAAYWQSFGYDALGDRTTETDHAVNGQTGDTTTTYTNGCTGNSTQCPNGPQPHTLTGTSTTGPAGTTATAFASNAIGATTGRTPNSGTGQTLHWDDEGHLDQVTQGASITKYLYDADGNQLIRRDPGQTTLFAGDTEIVVDTSVSPAVLKGAVRTYSIGGKAVAMASSLPGGGVDYVLSDPQDTATLLMDTTTQKASRKQYTPYGQTRGTTGSGWIDPTHGFLAKPVDLGTGYTDVGARKYDPNLGRFISGDPVFQSNDPQQLGGYTYAGSNPVTHTDPTGTRIPDEDRMEMQQASSSPSSDDNPCGGRWCADDSDSTPPDSSSTDSSSSDDYSDAMTAGWGDAEEGSKRVYMWVPPKPGPGDDEGIIMARFFIKGHDAAMGALLGDDRDFSDNPVAPHRMVLFWDTATGEMTFTVSPSHTEPTAAYDIPERWGQTVHMPAEPSKMIPARDIVVGPSGEVHDIATWKNYINPVSADANGARIDVNGLNSLMPVFPVQASLRFGFNSNGTVRVERQGTAYPSMEVVQYRQGKAPKVLAQDSERTLSGNMDPGLNAFPGVSSIDKLWDDGKCWSGC